MAPPTETVLVTGASSGIGRELTRLFAADGSDVVLVARSVEALEELAAELTADHGVGTHVVPADLSDPAAPARIADELGARDASVDVLVNNAGFGANGPFVDLSRRRQLDMIRVNVTALTELTRRLLPPMVERGRGGVLNVASTAAFQAGPRMAVYYATKAYVLSFSEAIAEEVRDTGVTVTCLAPGATETGFAERADVADAPLFRLAMGAAAVARAGLDGFRAGETIVVPGLRNRLGVHLTRLVPRAWARRLAARMQ